jgi:parvulin-like peptidyl-prolyl isomerase
MKKARFLSPFALGAVLLVGVLAGCGGGGSSGSGLKSSDVAVVGSTHISKDQFDTLLLQAKASYTQQGKKFPKQGTTEYETVKSQAVALLVQQAERTQKAKDEGITITDKQVEARLKQIKKQYFGGSEKKYVAQLKKQHLTDQQVHDDIRSQLSSEAVFAKVTKGITVSSDDVHSYYLQHATLYSKAQTRDVRHILVKSKPLAESIFSQLKAGNTQTWCKLAKKYSQDPSSKNACGKLTISKGQTVPEFDKVAFSNPTNVIHAPIHNAQYGWFVIEPISIVHPRSTTPEKQVAATIKTQLLQQKKNQAMTDWVSALSKTFCGGSKIKYQVGYTPSPDPCASTTSTNTTT